MALTTPFFVEDKDEEVPEGIPRHGGNQRPKIRHADDPTQMSYWPRASSFAERVSEMFVLDRHNERLVARGMAVSPDLCELVASLAGLEERADKDETTRIANLAKTAAGGDRKANRGTALHKLRERHDRGEDLAFVPPRQWEALQAWIKLMEPFEQYASETFVVNDRWQVAGSFDVLLGLKPGYELVAPDGEIFLCEHRIGGDLKSGERVDGLGALEKAVQQVVYFGPDAHSYVHVSDEDAAPQRPPSAFEHEEAAPVRGDNGRRSWPGGIAPSQTWSLIPHVPLEHPEDAALWWVDLTKAARISDQVAVLHELRKTEGLIVPAEPPKLAAQEPPYEVAGATHEVLLKTIRLFRDSDRFVRLWELNQDVWTDEHTAAANQRMAKLSAGATEVRRS